MGVAMVDVGSLGGPRALILMTLIDGPKHGYAIIDEVESTCGVTLGPGTLYGALTSLEGQGLITPLAAQGRRRPYELTSAGRAAAVAQEEIWRSLAAESARKRVAHPGRRPGTHIGPAIGGA